jgi:hypothetical protein
MIEGKKIDGMMILLLMMKVMAIKTMEVKFGMSVRDFLSEHFIERDMLHTGRRDIIARLDVTYNILLSKRLSLALMYEHNRRKAGSISPINNELIDKERSFNQNIYSVSINYKLSSKKVKEKKIIKNKHAKSKTKNSKAGSNNNIK